MIFITNTYLSKNHLALHTDNSINDIEFYDENKNNMFAPKDETYFNCVILNHNFKSIDKLRRVLIMHKKNIRINLGINKITNNKCYYIDSNISNEILTITLKLQNE